MFPASIFPAAIFPPAIFPEPGNGGGGGSPFFLVGDLMASPGDKILGSFP